MVCGMRGWFAPGSLIWHLRAEVLFFVPSSIGSYCFLLLVAWLVSLSCLVCERASYLHLFGFEQFGAWSISLLFCERLKWKRWETMLLIVMLESSSRSAPSNKAMLLVCSIYLLAWCSTIVEVSCSSLIPGIIECKYSRVTMARSCPSSASKATNQASSKILSALRSITIMIASSSLIT